MQKKFLFMLIVLFLGNSRANACDICGCGLGGLYFGIFSFSHQHFIGLRYGVANFKASILYNSFYVEDEFSEDTYQRYDLMGSFSLSPRLKLNFIAPYMQNSMNGTHQKVNMQGIGDPSILLYYKVLNTKFKNPNSIKHSLMIGAGAKLPLANHQAFDKGKIINRNFQLGSGSMDYLVSMNYTVFYQKIGLNLESAYKINTENPQNYRFGNQMNTNLYLLYTLSLKKAMIVPYAGLYFEQAEPHRENEVIQRNTGGSSLMLNMGFQASYRNIDLNLLYQLPLQQDFNVEKDAKIEMGNRFSIGVLYNFSFSKKESD